VNDSELRRSIVRVAAGDATGTGFVVAPGLVLTCHHVVAGAGTPTVWVGSVPTPVDGVTLPPVRDGRPVFDLAVLRAALPGLPAVDLDTRAPEPGDELFTFGFTDMYPQGDSALFVFEGPSVERDEPLYRLRSAQARPGLSGAPLLSRRTKRVVGVVSRSRDRDSDLGARAVPIGAARRLLPGLAASVPEPANDDHTHLARLIAIHERNVRLLETQVAGYGALDVPVYKQTQLDDERAELARLRSRLEGSP
jgi:S1-C subfamily serine protease